MVNGEVMCKARLVAKGFEEKGRDLSIDAPTSAPKTLKVCVAKISEKGWKIHSLDIKTAYLQGDEIKRTIYLRPTLDARERGGLWRLRKRVYGLKDAARG